MGILTPTIGALVLCALGNAGPAHPPALDPALGTRTPVGAHARALADRGLIAVHVYTDRHARGTVGGAIRGEAGATLVRAGFAGDLGLYEIETTPEAAARLARTPGVRWIEEAPEPSVRNATLRQIVQTGSLAGTPFDDLGLTGAGQIVGVIDEPLDWDHCAFVDTNPIGPTHRKIVAYNAPLSGVSAHGTHVCGTLAGDSNASPDLRGVAPGARLAFATIPAFGEATLLERLETHASQGARTHSLSWGDEQSSSYGGLARAIDDFCWRNDAHLVVVACANQSQLRTPENAKNALSVSASLDAPNQHRFCIGPAGPTADGRRKPELVAPGCSIFSAYPFGAGCPTVFSSGTSIATPAVAGGAAIVRQYFEQGWAVGTQPEPGAGFEPTGPLVKATLIAGAADLTNEPGWPSAREGWGRVMLAGSLPVDPAGPDRLLFDQRWNNDAGPDPALGAGDVRTIRFEVVDASRPVRAVLCWHDAPGAFGAVDPVVNDLDLVITSPAGAVFVGNDIDPMSGASVTRTSEAGLTDTRNTAEVIALPTPEPGVYTITVRASAIGMGTQGFGLAVVGGVRAVAVASCNPADLAEPRGVLDLADINAFVASFTAQSGEADLDGSGVFDLADINAFVIAFTAGCP